MITTLNFVLIYHLSEYIECVFIEVNQVNMPNVFIGCVYRPPNTDVALFNAELSAILDILNRKSKSLSFIMGDYNLDLLQSCSHTPTSEFLACLASHSFLPTIRFPTKITVSSATLLDNIF